MVAKIYPEIIACIYLIKTPNGAYIGRAEHFYSRIVMHYKDLVRSKHCNFKLQAEHDLHGYSCFVVSILERIEQYSENEIRALEKQYIKSVPQNQSLNLVDGYQPLPHVRTAHARAAPRKFFSASIKRGSPPSSASSDLDSTLSSSAPLGWCPISGRG